MSIRRVSLLPILSVLALTGPVATAQGTAGAQDTPYKLSVTTQSVVLDVIVTDHQGHVITNLKRDDFVIYDDKAPQDIRTFDPPPITEHNPNPPVHSTAELDRLEPAAPVTVIVLDEINTSFQDEAFGRYSLKQFLDKQGDQLDRPTMLGAVDMSHFTLLHDYTTSKQELLDALAKHKVVYPEQTEGSNWHAQQYIASFAGLLEVTEATAGHPGHKSLLWVGRGFPPFDITSLGEADSEGLRQVIDSCINAMRDARVVLDTIDPAGLEASETQTADPETGMLDDFFNGELDFSKMAAATGGHSFFGRNDVDRMIDTSQHEAASFYTLSYKPTTPHDDHNFHNIRVVMKDPNLVAETREGYYAHPPVPAEVVNPKGNRTAADLGLAAHSTIPYDAIHMRVQRLPSDPDKFLIALNSNDVTWTAGPQGKVITKITVVAESFDRKGEQVNHSIKLSTLGDAPGPAPETAADPTVKVLVTVPTKGAETVRIIIRDESNQKIGALTLPLATLAAEGLSN